jgi:gas vesicle protein
VLLQLALLRRLVRLASVVATAPDRAGRRPLPLLLDAIVSRPAGHARTVLGGIRDMKFVLGLLTGLVLGAVGAVLYSVRTGRDLRDAVDQVRSDLDNRDLDALGARIEARFTQMQAQLERSIGQAREKATAAVGQASDAAHSATEQASGGATEGADRAVDAATDGASKAADAVKKGVDKAVDAASTAVETASAEA